MELVCPNCKSVYFAIVQKMTNVGQTVANSQVVQCANCHGLYDILDGKLVLKAATR